MKYYNDLIFEKESTSQKVVASEGDTVGENEDERVLHHLLDQFVNLDLLQNQKYQEKYQEGQNEKHYLEKGDLPNLQSVQFIVFLHEVWTAKRIDWFEEVDAETEQDGNEGHEKPTYCSQVILVRRVEHHETKQYGTVVSHRGRGKYQQVPHKVFQFEIQITIHLQNVRLNV